FLQPAEPITGLEVLNPSLLGDDVDGRGAIVDLMLRFDGGTQVHVEMQLVSHPAFVERALFYWARAFSRQLAKGAEYTALRPTIGIFILNDIELSVSAFHSRFRLLEADTGELLTEALTLHFVELPKIPRDLTAAQSGDPVLNWAKFFAATSDDERHEIAMSDIQLKSLEEALR